MKTRTWNLLFVAGLTIAALVWLVALWRATMTYQPVYRQRQAPGAPLPALVPRLVLVIVDGLRYDLSQEMPCLQQVRQAGAGARSIAVLPSVSQPSWTALVSGASPELSGAALTNADYAELAPIQVDHLFQLAKQRGLTTALAGQRWWSKMVPPAYLDRSHFVKHFDAEGDREATQAAVEFLQDADVDFLLLYLGEHDEVSHAFGGMSQEARRSAARADAHLCTLLPLIDLKDTVLIVTSDHGHLDRGGHGGDESVVRETPFVLAGPRVRPGDYAAIQETDIAMTVAALLGLPLPRSGQGRILYDLLDTTEAERAQGRSLLVAQQLALADAYLSAIGAAPLPAQASAQAEDLDRLLRSESFAEADSLATTILEQIDRRLEGERAAKINRTRLQRLPLALAGLALALVAFVVNGRAAGKTPLLLSLVGVVVYHAFYVVRGHAYSLSTLSSAGSPARFAVTVVGGALIAFGLGLILLYARQRVGRLGRSKFRAQSGPQSASKPPDCGPAGAVLALPRLASSPALSISALGAGLVGALFVQALAAHVGNGGLGHWGLVVPTLSFLLLFSLLQTSVAGFLALAAILVSAVVARL